MKLVNLNNLHIYFFYFFLFSIPFQTRKVFLTEYSFYSGAFTEWTTFFVYASDVFLILALFFWFVSVLRNFIEENVKNEGNTCKFRLFLAKLSKFSDNKFKKVTKSSKSWLFLAVFLVWITLTLVINDIYFEISAFQLFKLIELSLLVVFVYFNLKSDKSSVFSSYRSFFSKYFSRLNLPLLRSFAKKLKLNEKKEESSKVLYISLVVIAFSGFLQSLIAIYQFVVQRSVFTSPILAKITGESIIGPQIPGVAKIVVDSEKIIRAYGTFPHPNILGGFLIFTLLITIYLYLEHKKSILSSELDPMSPTLSSEDIDINISEVQYNNTDSTKSQDIEFSLFWITVIFAQTTALFFTFSRTAWAGFLLSLFIITIFHFYSRKSVSRETIEENFLFNKGVLKEDLVLLKQINLGLKRFFNGQKIQKIPLLSKISRYFHSLANRRIQSIDNNVSLVYPAGKCETFKKKKLRSNTMDYSPPERGRQRSWWGVLEILKNYDLKLSRIVSRPTIQRTNEILPEITSSIKNIIIRFKELSIVILLMIIIIISNLSLIQARFGDSLISNNGKLPDNSAISDRSFYNNVSRETIYEDFILGSGLGTYIFQIDGYLEENNIEQKLQSWQYQPAHNIYFLIASEIGIVGLLFFLLFIMYVISDSIKNVSNVSRETFLSTRKLNYFLLAIFISFLFIGLFDHYFWTLQQGRLIFWLVLGMILINSSIILEENRD